MDGRSSPDRASPPSSTASIITQTNSPDLPTWQATLISQIVASLKLNYVLPEKLPENLSELMISKFKDRFLTPDYATEEGVVDKKQFANDVTEILRKLINDDHLLLSFEQEKIAKNKAHIISKGKLPEDRGLNECVKNGELTDEEREERKRRELEFVENKCGIHDPRGIDVGRVPENIGYIGLDFMADAEIFPIVREKVCQAILSVQDKDAVIIDLRNNGGGAPTGVQHLLSFFLPEGTHINTIQKRGDPRPKEFKTLPKKSLSDSEVGDLSEKPVYILINERTISAGEELPYDMQQLQLKSTPGIPSVTIIGMPSAGAAHSTGPKPLLDPAGNTTAFNQNFILYVPSCTSVNPWSRTNWEDNKLHKGVQPDIFVRNITYDLALMSDDIVPEKGKFYVRCENDTLEYKVMNPRGEVVMGKIEKKELEDAILFPSKVDILTPFILKKLDQYFPRILDVASRNGHISGTDALTLAVEKIQALQQRVDRDSTPSPS